MRIKIEVENFGQAMAITRLAKAVGARVRVRKTRRGRRRVYIVEIVYS